MLQIMFSKGILYPTITYVDTLTASSNSSASGSYSFGSSAGTKKLVVVMVAIANSSVDISSVTVGGVSLTLDTYYEAGDNNRVGIAYGYNDSAFTGSKTVTVTCSGTSNSIAASIYYSENIVSGTPETTKKSNVATNGASIPFTGISLRAVMFGVFGTSGGTAADSPTWTNMTIDNALVVNSDSSIHGSSIVPGSSYSTALSEPNLIDNSNRALIMKVFR